MPVKERTQPYSYLCASANRSSCVFASPYSRDINRDLAPPPYSGCDAGCFSACETLRPRLASGSMEDRVMILFDVGPSGLASYLVLLRACIVHMYHIGLSSHRQSTWKVYIITIESTTRCLLPTRCRDVRCWLIDCRWCSCEWRRLHLSLSSPRWSFVAACEEPVGLRSYSLLFFFCFFVFSGTDTAVSESHGAVDRKMSCQLHAPSACLDRWAA